MDLLKEKSHASIRLAVSFGLSEYPFQIVGIENVIEYYERNEELVGVVIAINLKIINQFVHEHPLEKSVQSSKKILVPRKGKNVIPVAESSTGNLVLHALSIPDIRQFRFLYYATFEPGLLIFHDVVEKIDYGFGRIDHQLRMMPARGGLAGMAVAHRIPDGSYAADDGSDSRGNHFQGIVSLCAFRQVQQCLYFFVIIPQVAGGLNLLSRYLLVQILG